MWPQIIYGVLLVIGLINGLVIANQKRSVPDAVRAWWGFAIVVALLWWGGFWTPLFGG